MTGRKVGSSVCEASSSMFFREGVPCGMSVAEDAREVSSLRAGFSLTCRDFQKGLEK